MPPTPPSDNLQRAVLARAAGFLSFAESRPKDPAALLVQLFLAIYFDGVLLGVVLMMGISYLRNYPKHGARWLVSVLLLGCTVQSGASAAAEVGILQRELGAGYQNWLAYAGTGAPTLISHLIMPFLMAIPHVLLTRQCMSFARMTAAWRPALVTVFGVVMWTGTLICFLTGEAAGIAIFIQSRMALEGKIQGDTISFFILFFSLNLPISAALDIILAITLSLHLLRSRYSLSSSTRTISILSALSNTLLANGAVLAVFQITVAAIFLSSTQYKDVAIGLTVLGKIYTITALLGITGPLEQGRREDSSRGSGGTTAEIRLEKELRRRSVGDAEGPKRMRWCFLVRRRASTGGRGQDEGELSFEEILQSGQSPRNTPTSSQPASASPQFSVTVLPRQPYSFSPAASGVDVFLSDPEANHGIDLRYVVSDMEDDGVVAKRSEK